MNNDDTRSLGKFDAPFGKQVEMLDVTMENNVRLLRVRIKEGSRFTTMDLDPVTAKHWGDQMVAWSLTYTESMKEE